MFCFNSEIPGGFSNPSRNSTEDLGRFVSYILAHWFQKMNLYIRSQAGHLFFFFFFTGAAVSQGAESEMTVRILREMKVKNRPKRNNCSVGQLVKNKTKIN